MGRGGSLHCGMLGIFLPNLAKPVEFSAEPVTRTIVLAFPLGVYTF